MKFPIQQLAAYNQAEIAIHRVAQFLALTGINLIPKVADDSHTNLGWDAHRQAITGRYFELSNQTMRLTFLLKEQELCFETKEGQLVASISLTYSDHESLMMWWRMQLQELGVRKDLIESLHYDLPDTAEYKGTEITDFEAFIPIWSTLRTQANRVFQHLNTSKKLSSEIRIWPHHFDTGVYYPLQADTHAIGAGMAMADTLQPEPYYYLYGWVKDQDLDFSDAPDLGKGEWLTAGAWKGAVLKVSEIEDLSQTEEVNQFLEVAFEFLNKQITAM